MYLCYDIKGIQQFIFSVPRLKCIVGASSQIARFDEETVNEFVNRDGCKRIFSGGGRGAFDCSTQQVASEVKEELVERARELGLDVRIGIDEEFSIAALYADELYPFIPTPGELDGLPCAESGLWPVPGSDGTIVHPLIEKRIQSGKTGQPGDENYDFLQEYVFDLIRNRIPPSISEKGYIVEFLRNVNPEEIRASENEKRVDQQRANAGQSALGDRNRWAIIAMDVNDMGQQFDALKEETSNDEVTYVQRLGIVSDSIKEDVTHRAFGNALVDVMQGWLEKVKPDLEKCWYEERGSKYLVLPFRPLVLGGDDVVLLCHSALAMDFVRKMAADFARLSGEVRDSVQKEHGFNPWPATDGQLTISAGVLFTKVTLPLHTAVPYAESLLDNAKNEFRRQVKSGPPTPAAVDWETVTDTMVDTPAARRNREMRFIDEEVGAAVYLTRRPYLLDEHSGVASNDDRARAFRTLEKCVETLGEFPVSFRADLKRALSKVWSERTRFNISMGKGGTKYRDLAESLAEPSDGTLTDKQLAWTVPLKEDEDGKLVPQQDGGKQIRTTHVVDAILLLDEKHRMAQETAKR